MDDSCTKVAVAVAMDAADILNAGDGDVDDRIIILDELRQSWEDLVVCELVLVLPSQHGKAGQAVPLKQLAVGIVADFPTGRPFLTSTTKTPCLTLGILIALYKSCS